MEQGNKISIDGKHWFDKDQYSIAYVGGSREVVRKDDPNSPVTTGGKPTTYHGQATSNYTKSDEEQKKENTKSAVSQTVNGAANVAATSMANAARTTGVTDPQQGHFNRQAALGEAQAAKVRADEQLARQEAYRNTGDRALTESAKMAEASSAANIRNNQKAMSAEMGGAAATMAAAKNANVDPMQNAMQLKNMGINRQDTATQLGKTGFQTQTAAEAQRASATQSQEEYKQAQERNAASDRASQAQAQREAEQRQLDQAEQTARTAKLQAEADKASAEGENTNVQTQAETIKQNQSAADSWSQQVDKIIQTKGDSSKGLYNKEDARVFYNYYIQNWKAKGGLGSREALQKIKPITDKDLKLKQDFINFYIENNGNEMTAGRKEINDILSDSRFKNIQTPAGKTLLHFYNGRT